MQIGHVTFKKVLPALGGEHILDFQEFSIHRNQHSDQYAIFKKVLPALGGEHNFDFHRLSKLRKIQAYRNRVHFLRL